MYETDSEGSLFRFAYKLKPQPGATADDVLAILASLHLKVDQHVYDSLPEETRRHFISEPV